MTIFCVNGSLVSYWISTGVDCVAMCWRSSSTARRWMFSCASTAAWLAWVDSCRLRLRSASFSWRRDAPVTAMSAAPMNRSRGTSAARCNGYSTVPSTPRTISSVLKRASDTRSAMARATKKMSARAQADLA